MSTPRFAQLLVFALSFSTLAARCGGKSDTAALLSGGDVTTESGSVQALNYQITSDNYKKWLAAQSALDSADVDPKLRINPRRLRADEIDRVVETLEEQETARKAIENSGLSVRDYVLTTVALAQSWDAVNGRRTAFTGIPRENIEFLRTRAADDPVARARPRARILDDDEDSDADDNEGDSGGRHHGRHGHRGEHGRHHGDDDSDSEH